MKSGTKDIVQGKLHQVKGKIKETIGAVAGNDRLAADGNAEKIGGKIQEKIGHAEKVLGK